MSFDGTITAGAVLMTLTMLAGFISTVVTITVVFTKLGGRLDLLAHRVYGIEQRVEGISTIPTRVAVLETNQANQGAILAANQKDLAGLRRGEGWITHPRDRVDGEYS